jgi:hypothetical protein
MRDIGMSNVSLCPGQVPPTANHQHARKKPHFVITASGSSARAMAKIEFGDKFKAVTEKFPGTS